MKYFKHYLILLLAALCTTLSAAAQGMTGSNLLHVNDLESQAGKTVAVTVDLANSDEVVGLQFNVQLPYDAITEAVRLADQRSTNGHAVSIRSLGSRKYTVVVSTLQNRTIPGSSGNIVIIPMPIPATAQMGARLPITVSDVVIANRRGDNIATSDPSAGSGQVQGTGYLTILDTPTPDYAVSDVAVDSPATSYSPEAKINVKWRVTNVGEESASGGWTENVYLVAPNGSTTLLGTSRSQATIAAGTSISRYDAFTIPKTPGIDGDCQIKVVLTPNAGTTEPAAATENNTAVSASSIELLSHYYLTTYNPVLVEGSTRAVSLTITRTGDRSIAETFSITTLGTGLISVPATVTIPAGNSAASFQVKSVDNSFVNSISTEIISIYHEGDLSDSGPTLSNPALAAIDITIEDDELQPLTLGFSDHMPSDEEGSFPDFAEITEGQSIYLVIDTDRPFFEDQELNLTCELPRRFAAPASVTLPAGQQRVVVNVATLDDIAPDLTHDVLFTVQGNHFTKAEGHVQLNDNDVPVLTLEFNAQTVGEGDGPACLTGVLRRSGVTTNEINVRFSDDASGNIYYSNKMFTLPRGVEEVSFNLGVIDNQEVDGERTVNVTAAVYVSDCGCTVGEGAGRVTVPITIIDNDGPTLSLRTKDPHIMEGDVKGTELTVTRNTSTEAPLTVNIEVSTSPNDLSDGTGIIFGTTSLTIPAGAKEATTTVRAAKNDIMGDSRSVTLVATADGYNRGTTWLRVVDETLPDLYIVNLTADKTSALPGSTVHVEAQVGNSGNFDAPQGATLTFSLDGVDFTTEILPGFSTDPSTFPTVSADLEIPLSLPEKDKRTGALGTYAIKTKAAMPNGMSEILLVNNESTLNVSPLLPFANVTISVDKQQTSPGQTVTIEGDVTLQPGLEFPSKGGNYDIKEEVEVYVMNNGTRTTLYAPINPNTGHYSTTYTVVEGSAGVFGVGACYPEEGKTIVQDSFNVYGLRRVGNEYITLEALVGHSYDRAIAITNPGTLGLTNIKVEPVGQFPSNYDIKFLPLEAIAPGEVLQLRYNITATGITESKEWDRLSIAITSDEGARYVMTLYCFARSEEAMLKSDITKINTTMVKGQSREYIIPIRNIGEGETGTITVDIPETDWLRLVTPSKMASLKKNEEDNIILSFTPNDNMPLNVPYSGTIAINCANGKGLPITYRVENVSGANGKLIVDVCDENTYYTAEAPHLADAQVVVRHPITNALITQGRTGADGLFTAELPEGYYTLNVTADEHDSYVNTVLIDPERETFETVNLATETISILWTVVETEVEDVYDIKTTMIYKTNVPAPVVKVDWPDKIDGDELIRTGAIQINAIMTNIGLITAKNVTLSVTTQSDVLEYEYLHENDFDLAPQQSVVFPVVIHYTGGGDDEASSNARVGGPRKQKGQGVLNCALDAVLDFFFDCGESPKSQGQKLRSDLSNCGGGGGGNDKSQSAGGAWGVPPSPVSGGGGASVSVDKIDMVPYEHTPAPCSPCLAAIAKAAAKAAITKNPVVAGALAVDNAIGCVRHITSDAEKNWDDYLCVADNIPKVRKVKAKIDDKIDKAKITVTCLDEALKKLEEWNKKIENIAKLAFKLATKTASHATPRRGAPDTTELEWPELYEYDYTHSEAFAGMDARFIEYLRGSDYISQYLTIQEARYHTIFGNEAFDEIGEEQFHVVIDALNDYVDQKISRDAFLAARPNGVSEADMVNFVSRIDHTYFPDPDDESEESSNRINFEVLDYFDSLIADIHRERLKTPCTTIGEWYGYLVDRANEAVGGIDENGVCAQVKLEISQQLVMTRQAFLGTLTVTNGHKTKPMTDVKLNLTVTNSDGDVVGRHEFQINPTSLEGFTGELNLGSGWTLNAGETGVAQITFIPTKYAATDEPEDYSFGGTFSYVNPYTGLLLTRELYPVTLTARPTAELDLTYFMQRDVLGDDPFTEVVEPMEEAEFALLIHNKGRGDATKVNITTEQPKIVENEKGLYVDFEIVSSQVNGQEKTMALGGTVPASFGTIPAGTTSYAQWMMTCSLLGHFAGYKVEASHVTSYDNPDLSLLDQVTIHELIRSIRVPDAEGNPVIAWLCNDLPDAHHQPDIIYSSDTQTFDVECTDYATEECSAERRDNTHALLSVFPQQDGWTYGACADPANGNAKLVRVTRLRDGKEIPIENCWLTAYTIPDDGRAINEYRVHIIDDMTYNNALAEKYELVYEPNPTIRLAVHAIKGRHENQKIEVEPVRTISITFNKDIDPETFTTDDLQLACQGNKIDLSEVTINHDDYRNFTLDLGTTTVADGYYVLTVNTDGIMDAEGFPGKDGKRHTWIAYADGLITLMAKAVPAEGGYVRYRPAQLVVNSNSRNGAPAAEPEDVVMTAEGQRVEYDTNPTLTAVPNKGYQFVGWYDGDAAVGTDKEYSSYYLDHTSLTARFRERTCRLDVAYDEPRGAVSGAASGYYPCNEAFDLHAAPKGLNAFLGWYVDGELLSTEADYPLVLDDDIELYAHFRIPGEFAAGDVDEDGDVDHDDVLALRSMLLREQPVLPTGDVNGDGRVTVADLAHLIDVLE